MSAKSLSLPLSREPVSGLRHSATQFHPLPLRGEDRLRTFTSAPDERAKSARSVYSSAEGSVATTLSPLRTDCIISVRMKETDFPLPVEPMSMICLLPPPLLPLYATTSSEPSSKRPYTVLFIPFISPVRKRSDASSLVIQRLVP